MNKALGGGCCLKQVIMRLVVALCAVAAVFMVSSQDAYAEDTIPTETLQKQVKLYVDITSLFQPLSGAEWKVSDHIFSGEPSANDAIALINGDVRAGNTYKDPNGSGYIASVDQCKSLAAQYFSTVPDLTGYTIDESNTMKNALPSYDATTSSFIFPSSGVGLDPLAFEFVGINQTASDTYDVYFKVSHARGASANLTTEGAFDQCVMQLKGSGNQWKYLSLSVVDSFPTFVTSVTLSETAKTVTLGDDGFNLTATVEPNGAINNTVSWTTSDGNVATVNDAGAVSIVGVGTATITASAGGCSASCVVTVEPAVVSSDPNKSSVDVQVETSDPNVAGWLNSLKEERGCNLVAEPASNLTDQAQQSVLSIQTGNVQVAELLDIRFESSDGQPLDFRDYGEITIKILMTDAMKALDPSTLKVCYVGDDGTIEEKTTWVEGDYLCFTTDHLSTYAVAGEPAAAAVEQASSPAKTGDSIGLVAAIGFVVALGAAGVLLYARRKAKNIS